MACELTAGLVRGCRPLEPGGVSRLWIMNFSDWKDSTNLVITRASQTTPITNLVATTPILYKCEFKPFTGGFTGLTEGLRTTGAAFAKPTVRFSVDLHGQAMINFFNEMVGAKVVAIVQGKGLNTGTLGENTTYIVGGQNGLDLVSDNDTGGTFGQAEGDFSGWNFTIVGAESSPVYAELLPTAPTTIESVITGLLVP